MNILSNKIFSQFVGKWILIRKFLNKELSDSKGYSESGYSYLNYKGIAYFDLVKTNNLFYREDLKINNPNSKLSYNFFKEYVYLYDKNKISKYFINNNLFYDLEFTAKNTATGKHYCHKDVYFANYNFINKNSFILFYEVKGPFKNYIIHTNYTRLTY